MLLELLGGNASANTLLQLVLAIPCIIIALSFHEAAHADAAYRMGDPTARNLGRLTLNPIKHLDLIGTLCMLVVGYGWAKPVPINTRYFKNQKKGTALTALAGPITNLALGIIGVLLYRLTLLFVFNTEIMADTLSNETKYHLVTAVILLLNTFSIYNFSFAIFNLIPIPPFDGSRVLFAFLPDRYYFGIMKYERYIMIALLVFMTAGPGFSIGSIVRYLLVGINSLIDLIPFMRVI